METVFTTELELLRWICKRKDGATVGDVVERFSITRQGAYDRLERLVGKGRLTYEYEESSGPRDQARYHPTAEAHEIVKKRWRWLSSRLMECSA